MDQTFFVFLVLFAILIIYLFKQKNDLNDMRQELNNFVTQENFDNQQGEVNVEVNEIDLTDEDSPLLKEMESNVQNQTNNEPQPMNQPDTPVSNGYSTTLIFNHPDKINGCDIANIAPMNYYKEVNQKINENLDNKVMNGGNFGDVIGYVNEQEDDYYAL